MQRHETVASVRRRLQPPRFLQVTKISDAVAIAWTLSPFLPGDAQELRYYAPLGALLSMHPTLMRSLRSALQILAGLAFGIALAGAVLILSEPSAWTIWLVIGLGSHIGGMRWLGVGGGRAVDQFLKHPRHAPQRYRRGLGRELASRA
ncbi:FUSC family protein [Cryobacterium sp. M23]|uniref:FUSC family protein n=1 Tax=Cryobacterium sp. M23 TaxID=2048292 RepID=UPI000CE31306